MNGVRSQTATSAAIVGAAFLTLVAVPAATASTAYVSVTGKNSSTCGKTPAAPCLTIAGALASAANGGGFMTVAIVGAGVFQESVNLTAPTAIIGDGANYQAISPGSGGPAITVNVGPTGNVRISNVQVLGNSGAVAYGLSVVSAKHVDLDHVVFREFGAASISFTNSVTAFPTLWLDSTTIHYTNGTGILVQPTSPNAQILIQNSSVEGCGGNCVTVDVTKTPSGQDTYVMIRNSYVGNGAGASVAVSSTASSGPAHVTLLGTVMSLAVTGVSASGPGSVVTLNGSTSEESSAGVAATNGAVIYSYGNNALGGAPTITPIPLQ